jgi:hypothetical protein
MIFPEGKDSTKLARQTEENPVPEHLKVETIIISLTSNVALVSFIPSLFNLKILKTLDLNTFKKEIIKLCLKLASAFVYLIKTKKALDPNFSIKKSSD